MWDWKKSVARVEYVAEEGESKGRRRVRLDLWANAICVPCFQRIPVHSGVLPAMSSWCSVSPRISTCLQVSVTRRNAHLLQGPRRPLGGATVWDEISEEWSTVRFSLLLR